MYLSHFQLKAFPFALTPSVEAFVPLPHYLRALNVLLLGLNNGEGFIKVIGDVGSGKTLLCRKLLEVLHKSEAIIAHITNPNVDALSFYKYLAKELQISPPNNGSEFEFLDAISSKIASLHTENKKVILVIDEAQAISDQNLEILRLLSNLDTFSQKLLQIVLFAQPEFDRRLKQTKLSQLRQRMSFAYYLKPLQTSDLPQYLHARLKMVALSTDIGELFSRKAYYLLYKASNGLPRLVNLLSHKALLIAYGLGLKKINAHAMREAIKDTECASNKYIYSNFLDVAVITLAVIFVVEIIFFLRFHL